MCLIYERERKLQLTGEETIRFPLLYIIYNCANEWCHTHTHSERQGKVGQHAYTHSLSNLNYYLLVENICEH